MLITYVTDQMRDALAGHRLRQVCNSGGVRVFRMAAPGTGIMAADLVFLPERTIIAGDIQLGQDKKGATSDLGYGFHFFSRKRDERYLCEKFLRVVWVPELALEAMREKVQEIREDFQLAPLRDIESSRLVALLEAIRDADTVYAVTRTPDAFADFWVQCVAPDGPDMMGYGYDPTDAGWLCAIHRRFAELWAERVSRIEAIVAGWEWIPNEAGDAWSLRKRGEGTPSIVFAHGAWHIARRSGSGGTVGMEGDGDAAKLAARAAVLAQAIEHPELWHCGEVEQ